MLLTGEDSERMKKDNNQCRKMSKEPPQELLIEILARLPTKSAIRFSSVSKLWLSIIKDSAFKDLHSKHSRQSLRTNSLILMREKIGEKNKISFNLLSIQRPILPNAMSHFVADHEYHCVGTCNGLLCFAPDKSQEPLFLCNPVTGEQITLPRSHCPFRAQYRHYYCSFAFGFCPYTEKYKVIEILSPRLELLSSYGKMMVYTVGNGKTWRKIKGFQHSLQADSVYINGKVYWQINCKGEDGETGIVCFDVTKETVTRMEYPWSRVYRRGFENFSETILELDGHLTAASCHLGANHISLWMLKDFDKQQWEKRYSFDLPLENLDGKINRLVSLCECDGVLLAWLLDGLAVYDIKRGTMKWYQGICDLLVEMNWNLCKGYRPSFESPKRLISGSGECSKSMLSTNEHTSSTDLWRLFWNKIWQAPGELFEKEGCLRKSRGEEFRSKLTYTLCSHTFDFFR
ncbi:F-box domain-containing protein [Dioscorea alata]|uniref:F-box domain-containing protein n=1 Tax=Dioscorea alata TaxID=55571 RepID=A0ACB7WI87_DIOAL|nr:F-box domain-containing protein [Dioscorea alata]